MSTSQYNEPEVAINPLESIRYAYQELQRSVIRALRTQVGDAARLNEQRDNVIRVLAVCINPA